ncbi:MAG: hypothetical protein H0T84_08975 [Tatlockia sp.]|nr:hypothetical protein [Tatlockia sp.]
MFQKCDKNPYIQRLRSFFYNSLADLAISDKKITPGNIEKTFKLQIVEIIINCLEYSKTLEPEYIQITEGLIINANNCPLIYMDFFIGLKEMTMQNKFMLMDGEFNLRDSYLFTDIENLAMNLMNSQTFKEILPQLTSFILEAKGVTLVQKQLDETDISNKLIRETFYNEMVTQTVNAISVNFISREDLENEEPFIYFALSGLTIFEAIYYSRNCSGIELLGGKVVNRDNCPESEDHIPLLVKAILNGKEQLRECYGPNMDIPDNDITAITLLCISKDIERPHEIEITPEAAKCASIINSMSSQISQSQLFKMIIPEVIEFCLACSEPAVKLY